MTRMTYEPIKYGKYFNNGVDIIFYIYLHKNTIKIYVLTYSKSYLRIALLSTIKRMDK